LCGRNTYLCKLYAAITVSYTYPVCVHTAVNAHWLYADEINSGILAVSINKCRLYLVFSKVFRAVGTRRSGHRLRSANFGNRLPVYRGKPPQARVGNRKYENWKRNSVLRRSDVRIRSHEPCYQNELYGVERASLAKFEYIFKTNRDNLRNQLWPQNYVCVQRLRHHAKFVVKEKIEIKNAF